MPPSNFNVRVQNAIHDPVLQNTLDRLQAGFVEKRQKAYDEIDFPTLSKQGATIRQAAVANLGELAVTFEAEAKRRGATVHWAEHAESANRIILDLCQEHGIKRLVKSKSMITEEIRLNRALEQANLDVVETDLGEYIIQLRRESPSHILAPAFHLNRTQVEETFRKNHTDLPNNRILDDKQSLMNEARNILREKFLRADAGITGANMLIASDGSIVLVTNEGNADLTFSQPRHHIVVTSIEKLVPDYRDAWVLLRLLARSATGQRSSVYTSFVRPSVQSDADGGRQLHIVLVDNGRSHWLNTPLEDALRCIRCGACMNHCPVFETIGGHAYGSIYPGPIGAVLSPGLFGTKEHGVLATASSFCGKCDSVCPVQVPLTRLMRTWRDTTFKRGEIPYFSILAVRLWSWLTLHPYLYRSVIGLGRFFLRRIAFGRSSFRLPILRSWDKVRDFPTPGTTKGK